MKKFIPILKVGRFKDASGRNCDITPQVLTDIVDSYKTKTAPLVKGHPNNEAPAMGWIEKLKIQGEELLASFSEVSEEFKSEVAQGLFKNISASFFMPLSESNPSKGKYCLRHVGALGASRPAIPNLGTLQEALAFSELEDKDRMSEVQNSSRMSDMFCIHSNDEVVCFSEFAEQEESLGFFEKLIKGAIEKALKKQREEIMAEVKRTFQALSFSEENLNNTEAGIQLSPSVATLDSDILSSGGINMSEKTARELELEQELQKQKDENDRLKSEQDKSERNKVIAEEVAKVKEEKNLDDAIAQKLTEKAESSAEADGKKAVADFSEFIEPQKKSTNHRFGDKTPDTGKGVANFSEGEQEIVNTVEYADEVEKHMKDGSTRQEAHSKAIANLGKK